MSAYTFTCKRCSLVQPFNDNLVFWECWPVEQVPTMRGYTCSACGEMTMVTLLLSDWRNIDAERAALAKESP